jgi:site-specific recombinase XerC
LLPETVKEPLRQHLGEVKALHEEDLEGGYDIRTVQELLGHKDVRTAMVYTHVIKKGGMGVRSPMDSL